MMIRPPSWALWATTLSVMLGASAVAGQKLEDVLAKQANLTTFRDLVKVRREHSQRALRACCIITSQCGSAL